MKKIWSVRKEKEGVSPDVLVEAMPEDLARGSDAQIAKAVEVLMQDVAAWKKARGAIASTPGSSNPMTVTTPVPK